MFLVIDNGIFIMLFKMLKVNNINCNFFKDSKHELNPRDFVTIDNYNVVFEG